MGRVIVVEFVTLDGVVEDPDGSAGTSRGGWALHAGPQVFAGDKFALGPLMRTGALLLGRSTWDLFAARWPERTGAFADALNGMAKVVVSSGSPDLDAWSNSSLLGGSLVDEVERLASDRDVVVADSLSVVHQLVAADAIDEYRLVVIPVALGTGTPLFPVPVRLRLVSSEPSANSTLTRYEPVREPAPPA